MIRRKKEKLPTFIRFQNSQIVIVGDFDTILRLYDLRFTWNPTLYFREEYLRRKSRSPVDSVPIA